MRRFGRSPDYADDEDGELSPVTTTRLSYASTYADHFHVFFFFLFSPGTQLCGLCPFCRALRSRRSRPGRDLAHPIYGGALLEFPLLRLVNSPFSPLAPPLPRVLFLPASLFPLLCFFSSLFTESMRGRTKETEIVSDRVMEVF